MDLIATIDFTQAARAVSVGLMGVLLGMSALVVHAYSRAAIRGGALPIHVTLIALSYCIFIISVGGRSLERVLTDTAEYSWTIYTIPLATILGIVALRVLLDDVRRRRTSGHVRRESDPSV